VRLYSHAALQRICALLSWALACTSTVACLICLYLQPLCTVALGSGVHFNISLYVNASLRACRASNRGGDGAFLHNAVLMAMAEYLGTLALVERSNSSESTNTVCSQQSSAVGLPGRPRQPCMPQPTPAEGGCAYACSCKPPTSHCDAQGLYHVSWKPVCSIFLRLCCRKMQTFPAW
jgi:hypothetical protein